MVQQTAPVVWLCLFAAGSFGCGEGPTPRSENEPGGTSAGGTSAGAQGGSAGLGGASSSGAGGTSANGGTIANGGSAASGGSAATGGSGETGGTGGSPYDYDPPTGTGTPGEWTKIEMPVSFTYAMSLVADPVRPNDYYGFLTDGAGTNIHVVKSTDYGASWTVINTTAMNGDPWGAAIDPNPNRDPDSPPTLYTPAGYGSLGLWKSVDGGVTWTQSLTGSTPFSAYTPYQGDIYSVSILPDDPPNHILVTYHGYWEDFGAGADAGFGESTDGGQTWIAHEPPTGIGQSHYLITLGTDTWISISQSNNGDSGIWKTTTAGRVAGEVSAAAWKNVDSQEHVHGAFHPFVTATALYAAGDAGLKHSTDEGETWQVVYDDSMTNVIGTERYLYGDYILGPNLVRASIDDDATWTSYTTTPDNMAGGLGPGAFTHVATTDGTQWYVVVNMNGGGVWRYVEPQ